MIPKFKSLLKTLLTLFVIVLCLSGCAKTEKRTVVKFASWGTKSELEILKPILADFEKENPDIKVEFIHIPQNYFQKIHLLFASNMAPDVLFVNNLYLPIYANAGVLQDMGELVSMKKQFFPEALEALTYKDTLYAVPRDVSNLVVYINKDIFIKYGVSFPNHYWTFNDLRVIAQKLTKDTNGDGKTDIWGISFEEDPMFYLPYLMSEGGGILSDDLNNVIITKPESKKGLQFYTDLRNKYNVAPKKSESASATMAQLFLQGKLAMHLSGRWMTPKYRSDAKFNWNVVSFPNGDKGSIVPMDASGWAISKSSEHKAEAIRLINYLSSQNSIQKYAQSGLIVPARIDVANNYFLYGRNTTLPPRNVDAFIDVIKTSKKTPVSVNYREVQDNLKEKTNYLFNSDKTVDEIFK